MPLTFYRRFTAGDLATRAQGIDAIRRTLSGVVLASVLAGVFSIWNLGLLFYLEAKLALVALVLTETNSRLWRWCSLELAHAE